MRKKYLYAAAALILSAPTFTAAQTGAQPTPAPRAAGPQQQQQRPRQAPTAFDLIDYGVEIEPEPRLVVMMAALDAAGWDPTPKGVEPSVFRRTLRKEQEGLDPALRKRMQDFYESNRLKGDDSTPAEQAARYVSLAYTLGPAPAFEAPPRSEDLPSGVLGVLDFVPLLREFYKQSAMDERVARYLRMHQEEGRRMRQPTIEMVRTVLTYLHTRPELSIVETIRPAAPAKSDAKKKTEQQQARPIVREKARRFRLVPDLLAAPGAINFRVIGDDYHAIAPFDTDPTSSEVRRAYILYVVDPLILRYGRDISAKRLELKLLLDEQRARNPGVTPDVFLSVARSLVAAADARIEETGRLRELQLRTSARLKEARDEAARALIVKESGAERRELEDVSAARLSEAYERGAVLSFYFAEQLRGLEASGFDISNFFGDMVTAVDPAREGRRLAESAEAVKRHREARERARKEAASGEVAADAASSGRRASLVKSLGEVNEMLRLGNYAEAEGRLRLLLKDNPNEPSVYFGLAQAASLSAQDAFDEALQAQRLRTALQLYQDTIRAASPDSDAALVSRAHAASGRILAHLERATEAVKEFDAAIRIGDVKGGAYREAVAERQKLSPQP